MYNTRSERMSSTTIAIIAFKARRCYYRLLLLPREACLKPVREEVVEDGAEDQPLVVVRHFHVADDVEVPQEARSDVRPEAREGGVGRVAFLRVRRSEGRATGPSIPQGRLPDLIPYLPEFINGEKVAMKPNHLP